MEPAGFRDDWGSPPADWPWPGPQGLGPELRKCSGSAATRIPETIPLKVATVRPRSIHHESTLSASIDRRGRRRSSTRSPSRWPSASPGPARHRPPAASIPADRWEVEGVELAGREPLGSEPSNGTRRYRLRFARESCRRLPRSGSAIDCPSTGRPPPRASRGEGPTRADPGPRGDLDGPSRSLVSAGPGRRGPEARGEGVERSLTVGRSHPRGLGGRAAGPDRPVIDERRGEGRGRSTSWSDRVPGCSPCRASSSRGSGSGPTQRPEEDLVRVGLASGSRPGMVRWLVGLPPRVAPGSRPGWGPAELPEGGRRAPRRRTSTACRFPPGTARRARCWSRSTYVMPGRRRPPTAGPPVRLLDGGIVQQSDVGDADSRVEGGRRHPGGLDRRERVVLGRRALAKRRPWQERRSRSGELADRREIRGNGPAEMFGVGRVARGSQLPIPVQPGRPADVPADSRSSARLGLLLLACSGPVLAGRA